MLSTHVVVGIGLYSWWRKISSPLVHGQERPEYTMRQGSSFQQKLLQLSVQHDEHAYNGCTNTSRATTCAERRVDTLAPTDSPRGTCTGRLKRELAIRVSGISISVRARSCRRGKKLLCSSRGSSLALSLSLTDVLVQVVGERCLLRWRGKIWFSTRGGG